MPLFIPSTLYYASAALTALTIPKHIAVGFQKIYPAVAAIPPRPELLLAKNLINPTWDYSNFTLVAVALLNLKWARNGSPVTMEEKFMVWANLIAGGVVGWQYFRSRMYAALPVLWVAPVLSLVASFWEEV